MRKDWKDRVAAQIDAALAKHDITLTLGGEPTYIPKNPHGAEWTYAAVGPTKLDYGWKVAKVLLADLPGGVAFFCPGKSYPGEVNPRWVIRLISNLDGSRLLTLPASGGAPDSRKLEVFREALGNQLGFATAWTRFVDKRDSKAEIWAVALDHDDKSWKAGSWKERKLPLGEAEGPAGLRLPLNLLPDHLVKRAITLEFRGGELFLFTPPVTQAPFLELLSAVEHALAEAKIRKVVLQGYTPPDEAGRWLQIGIAADPGVLEINLPACRNWKEYAYWIDTVTKAAETTGLRSWKQAPWEHPAGTGGGNHLLWGGPTLDENPFFTRPAWLAAILRYWQSHPSLAYLFTGCYVGPSSQAPRPDESARDLYDLDMAYAFLEKLPLGDHRGLINETLRHLQTDATGNSHRSEVSFDKFWNLGSPAGTLGLIEFRAIESLPTAEWMSAIPLLWTALAAYLLDHKPKRKLHNFRSALQDRYFLPSVLWRDLELVLADLARGGFVLDGKLYRDIWEWKFPTMLSWTVSSAKLEVRVANEGWPLLCETPVDGGSTSRFVDTSMQRLEFCANAPFGERYRIHVSGRPMPLHVWEDGRVLAGLRYRKTNLYPSLHPGIPPQLPLRVTIVDAVKNKAVVEFELAAGDLVFRKLKKPTDQPLLTRVCKSGRSGNLTYDLRIP